MMVWVIRHFCGFEAVELVKETDRTVTYIDKSWSKIRESRCDKSKILNWRGDEEAARRMVAQLTAAQSEHSRRASAADDWFARRKEEILSTPPPQEDAGQ